MGQALFSSRSPSPSAVDLLERASNSSNRVSALYNTALNISGQYPLLHKRICGLLVKAYETHLPELRICLQSLPTPTLQSDLLPALLELCRILHNGEHFVRLCCDSTSHRWPQRAILLAPCRDGLLVHLHDFLWCVCVVRQAIHAASAASVASTTKRRELIFCDPDSFWLLCKPYGELQHTALDCSTLEALEKEDADTLTEALGKMIQNCRNHGDEYRIAELLIRRLAHSVEAGPGLLPESLYNVPSAEFIVKDVLGRGAFGSVHKIEWLGEEFAEKRIFGVTDLESLDEAAILQALQHPYAVFSLCHSVYTDSCSIVMEKMEQDLDKFIKKRCELSSPPFRLHVAVDIMLQIAQAMAYVHSKNIIHRDLKPKNILVNVDPIFDDNGNVIGLNNNGYVRVKVTDFGVSKLKPPDDSKFTTLKTGTGYWRAPELFTPNTKYTVKADVYSFAVVCYEILTGQQPWMIGDQKSHTGWRPSWPPAARVPLYLSSYIERCWDTEPTKRPCFAQICRTLRHLKGALLRSQTPETLSLLSRRVSIEQKMKNSMPYACDKMQASTADNQLKNMPYEMFVFRVMEDLLLQSSHDLSIDAIGPMEFLEEALEGSKRIHKDYQQAVISTQGRNPLLHKGVGILGNIYEYHLHGIRECLFRSFPQTIGIPYDLVPELRRLSGIVHDGEQFVHLCCDSMRDRWPQPAIPIAPTRDGIVAHLCVFLAGVHNVYEAIAHRTFFWSSVCERQEVAVGDRSLLRDALFAVEKQDDTFIKALRKKMDDQGDHQKIVELLIHRLGGKRGSWKIPQSEILPRNQELDPCGERLWNVVEH